MKSKPTDDIEFEFRNRGYEYVVGVDEAGRGPLVGPVVAAAVYIPDGVDTSEFNDSKKLSAKKRERLAEYIKAKCQYSTAMVHANIIDQINIREATKLAMRQAVNGLDITEGIALIDGNFIPEFTTIPCQAVINGDARSVSIAAASIVAKVERDAWAVEFHKKYPAYGVKNHKGYGTKFHREILKEIGPSPEHRKSFRGVV